MMNNKRFEEQYLGKQFSSLTILERDKKENGDHVLYCIADCNACGNRKRMLVSNIIYGFSKTCGCGQVLAAAKARRMASKLTIETSQGPKSLRTISETYGVPYQQLYYRVRNGAKTIEELLNRKRKPRVRRPDKRLNGLTQVEASKEYGLSKQLINRRLKNGWTINEKGAWVSPTRGVVGTRVYRMSNKARKRLLKRKYLEKLYD